MEVYLHTLTVPSNSIGSSFKLNTELNDLRIIICLRKSEITVERISICNVIEKLMEYDCLPCS